MNIIETERQILRKFSSNDWNDTYEFELLKEDWLNRER